MTGRTSGDVVRLVTFYQGLGFREAFRTPTEGTPDHMELVLDRFTIGIASVDAATADHGLEPNLDGRAIESSSGPTTPIGTTLA